MAKRKSTKLTWSKVVEEAGLQIRIFERCKGGVLCRSVVVGDRKDRRSLGHRDRVRAEQQVRAFARALAGRQASPSSNPLTLERMFTIYFAEKAPLLSPERRSLAACWRRLFEGAWSPDMRVADICQTHVDRYCEARRNGTLTPFRPQDVTGRKGRKPVRVRDGTLDGDFRWLSSVFNWARKHKIEGERLLLENPLHDVRWPREKNVRRPVASDSRYRATLAKADLVDPVGRLRCMLSLARYTGRRESAICNLLASDVLLSGERVRGALAEFGSDERAADHMPHGAIRWRAQHDKQGFDRIAPLNAAARQEVDLYLRRSPRLGDAPLFPTDQNVDAPMRKDVACSWLVKAEKLAGLPKLVGGTWHPYRRLWAMEAKHLPDVDVAAAGGWRDTRALKISYQQPDPETMLRVVNAVGGNSALR